jgi:3',5'-cyclic AMP phosphodiesterase CpdA
MKLLFVVWIATCALWAKEDRALYVTWQHDPTSTLLIHWLALDAEPAEVTYRVLGERVWERQGGISAWLPEGRMFVQTVELMDLCAGTDYEFRIEEEIYRFRTLPLTLERPLRFVVGGDAYFHLSSFKKMNVQIAAQNPDFVIVGGDIAYTCGAPSWIRGKKTPLQRWKTFFEECKETLVTRDGRLIPLIPVIGNHDVKAASMKRMESESLFFELFAFPRNGIAYRTIDVGSYLSLFLLDSGHSSHVGGVQAQWLKKSLAMRENRAFKFAAYHIGGYPSCYPYDGRIATEIRTEWSCLFERYHVHAAFEHHNHAYKRTYPLKAGEIDPDGIVYMGDGSWGVSPRAPKAMWYLCAKEKANAVCVVTLSSQSAVIEALRADGKIIDAITVSPTTSQTFFPARCLRGG